MCIGNTFPLRLGGKSIFPPIYSEKILMFLLFVSFGTLNQFISLSVTLH